MPLTADDIGAVFADEPPYAKDTYSEDDDGVPRPRWTISHCPVAECCTDKAWKRCQRSTLISEAKLRGIVAHHLRTSGNHQMAADEANLVALDENRTIITEDEETFEEREAARRDAALAKIKQDERQKERRGEVAAVEQQLGRYIGGGPRQISMAEAKECGGQQGSGQMGMG